MMLFHSQIPRPTPEAPPGVADVFWSVAPWIFGVMTIFTLAVVAGEWVWKRDGMRRVRPGLLTGAWGVVAAGWFLSGSAAILASA